MSDCYQSHKGEQIEAMEILRQAFPDQSEQALAGNAMILRSDRYRRGRYLTVEEIRNQWPPIVRGQW